MANGRWEPKFSDSKHARGTKGGTYVDIALDVPDEDEVAGACVADVGVDGDRASGVALDEVGGGVEEAAGTVDAADGGPKHI